MPFDILYHLFVPWCAHIQEASELGWTYEAAGIVPNIKERDNANCFILEY
ncbi:hypothetical protein A3Q56_00711 [Intoshia linei]|uniref:Uncharacterized protein n=1 Tax=Intoshia linei TaxID=1819745 RepID=A0A177BBG2_9BILA|nr:hypothetical protein A3Q56_00711 [Intoshia linei]